MLPRTCTRYGESPQRLLSVERGWARLGLAEVWWGHGLQGGKSVHHADFVSRSEFRLLLVSVRPLELGFAASA